MIGFKFPLCQFPCILSQYASRLQHGYCIGVSRQSAQATVGKGLAQGPYMAARAGVEPTTLRLKAIDSTKAPPCLNIKSRILLQNLLHSASSFIYSVCINFKEVSKTAYFRGLQSHLARGQNRNDGGPQTRGPAEKQNILLSYCYCYFLFT